MQSDKHDVLVTCQYNMDAYVDYHVLTGLSSAATEYTVYSSYLQYSIIMLPANAGLALSGHWRGTSYAYGVPPAHVHIRYISSDISSPFCPHPHLNQILIYYIIYGIMC